MHQIRYFLAVAETLNFTRAAEACNVTQPSLSRAVQRLEDELGGALFHRERNRTHLTSLGREMLPLLRQVFDGAAAAKEHASSHFGSDAVRLRIGLSLTVHPDLISPLFIEMTRTFPGLEVNLVRAGAEQILKALEAGDLELAVLADSQESWDRLDHWPMFSEGFVLLAPPDWRKSTVTLSDVRDSAVIARPYCETLPIHWGPATADADAPQHRHEVSSDEDAANLVRGGLGVAIVPESTGRLLSDSVVTIENFEETRTVGVYGVAGRRRSAAANTMLKLLRAKDWSVMPSN